jgi:hypothetical protein
MPRRRELLTVAALGIAGCAGLGGDTPGDGSTDAGDGTDADRETNTPETGEDGTNDEQAPTDGTPVRGPITIDAIKIREATFVIPGESFLADRFAEQSSYSIIGAEVAIAGRTWVDDGSVTRSDPVALSEATIFAPADVWEQDLPDLEAELAGIDRRSERRTGFPVRELVNEDVHVYYGSDLESALDAGVAESEVAALLEASGALYDDQLRDAEGAFRERIEDGYVFVLGDRYFPGSETDPDETLFPGGTQFESGQWVGGKDGDTEGAAFPNGTPISGSFFADGTAFVRGTGDLGAYLDDRQREMYDDWLALLAEGGVLLPPGSWAEGTLPPGATPTPTATPDPTADWPDDPAFTPNPDVQGPGGDVVLSMAVKIADSFESDTSDIETFEVEFDRIDLHTAGGDTVPVQADVTVDLLAFDPGTTITVIFDVDIPAGRYTEIDIHTSPIEIVHTDDGDVTGLYEDPPRTNVGSDADDPGVGVNGGDGLRLDSRADVFYESGDYIRLEDESVGALATGIQSVVTDPDRFTDDDEE